VVYAIQLAETFLEQEGKLYCLGDIVHNDLEIERLHQKGLEIIDHEQLAKLKDCTVLIRAHGEPPATYELAVKNNIRLIDASCPVVLKLQNRVKQSHDLMEEEQGQVVIYGKPGHAEVNGILGQVHGDAIVITGPEDLDKIDYSRPVTLYSQTTQSTYEFYRIKKAIEEKAREEGNEYVVANDTICRQVSNREPALRQFAAQNDVILFVSGRKSSNGKVLFAVCREVNDRSYKITGPGELNPAWLENADSVGICGATSTPMWLMEQVAERVKDFI